MFTLPEPEWRSIQDLPAELPPLLLACITTTNSLTSKLRTLGELQVEVINEYIKGENQQWCRDVILSVNHFPAVIGHSTMPSSFLEQSDLKHLKNLGARPLGEIIFTELKGVRERLEYAIIEPSHALFVLAKPYLRKNVQQLYARRSWVNIKQHFMCIHEVFLPTFLENA